MPAEENSWVLGADGALTLPTDQCLTASEQGVGVAPCDGTLAQHWVYERTMLRSDATNRCLSMPDEGHAPVLALCSNLAGQSWQLPLPDAQ